MRDKRFKLEKGDNGFWIIKNKDKHFLSMRYNTEARVVVDYLNLNEEGYVHMARELSHKKDLIRTLQFENYKLKQLLKEHNIEVLLEEEI